MICSRGRSLINSFTTVRPPKPESKTPIGRWERTLLLGLFIGFVELIGDGLFFAAETLLIHDHAFCQTARHLVQVSGRTKLQLRNGMRKIAEFDQKTRHLSTSQYMEVGFLDRGFIGGGFLPDT